MSDLGKVLDPVGITRGGHGDASIAGEFFGSEGAINVALNKEAAAMEALEFEREMADILRSDAAPLRDIRNQSLLDSLEFLRGGTGTFLDSAEFTGVRDAAMMPANTAGIPEGARNALLGRATNLALGEYQPFTNRIFNTAGITSQGLNNTNSLLQQNADAQAALLGQAGASASGGLLDAVQGNQQSAMGLIGVLGSMFSDERLKENIEYLYTDEDGVEIHSWDWTEEALEIVGDQPTVGPIAQKLIETHPHRVTVDSATGYYKVT